MNVFNSDIALVLSSVTSYNSMTRYSRSLSLFIFVLILSGLFSSSVHLHDDLYEFSNSDQQIIVQDHNFCTICASQFKYEVSDEAVSVGILYESFYHFSIPTLVIYDPLISIQNYRAPPSSNIIA